MRLVNDLKALKRRIEAHRERLMKQREEKLKQQICNDRSVWKV